MGLAAYTREACATLMTSDHRVAAAPGPISTLGGLAPQQQRVPLEGREVFLEPGTGKGWRK